MVNIKTFLDQDQKKDLLRLLTAGSVDDGKSTLIGRLLFDSKKLYEDQLSTLKKDSKREGHAGDNIDYALLLDGLKAEREQGITIDVAYRYFSTNKRKFIIADTPGHEQYTRNMVTGASTANLAIILVDATKGVITQTKRHTYLVSLLGIKHIVLAVNKMDIVNYDENVYKTICEEYTDFVTKLSIPDVRFFPLSALHGENVVKLSKKMPWYRGKSILEHLELVNVASDRNYKDFRFPVQNVLRPDRKFRAYCGRVASGIIKKNDKILILPSKKRSKITSIISSNNKEISYAFPPQSVSISLNDEIDISRGDMIVHTDNQPRMERHFEAMLVWMDEKPMNPDSQIYIKHNTNITRVRIDKLKYKIDVNTLERKKVKYFKLNEIGRIVITTNKPIYFDPYHQNAYTGSFILIDTITNNTCAVGMIIDRLSDKNLPSRITDFDRAKIDKGQSLVTTKERMKRYNHKGFTIWITGLHGAGKNELAYSLEKQLFDTSAVTVLLDGSTVRSGLSKELDFSPADRAEHLRRVAHICRILNDQGIITICSFISPENYIRKQISEIIGKVRFKLIYMNTDIETCKKNRPRLYKKAINGEIKNVPGVDEEFEIPQNADFVVDKEDIEHKGMKLVNLFKI